MSSNETNAIDYYDKRWLEEQLTLSSEALLRLSRILWGFAYLARHDLGRVSGTPHHVGRICDLGCGSGRIASHLTEIGEVTGIDYSAVGIELAKRAFPKVHFEVGDVMAYLPPSPFDVVVSSEVIEHVPNKEAYAATCRNCLSDGGYLILTCPNGRYMRLNRSGTISNQPIEEWPTARQLLGLFRPSFDILFYDTFRTDYFHTGISRFTNSYKVRTLVNSMNFDAIYDEMLGRCGLGLYQVLIMQKKRSN
jgi:SAM-dependent methyltransferase